jgi:DNA-binding transcriptional ArsR family regulator
MRDGPDISKVAALMGDPARSNMLLSLMDGRALTASELAATSNVTKQTASSHLSRMVDGGLLSKEVQGRHRYFRLSNGDVAQAIEALLNVAESGVGKRTRTGPKDPALRKSRICYDHLAGEMGVSMYERMTRNGWIQTTDDSLSVTPSGWEALREIGICSDDLPKTRRPQCKTCLDWSMRRHHLAGQVGAEVLTRFFDRGWAKRRTGTRIIEFSKRGEVALDAWLNSAVA